MSGNCIVTQARTVNIRENNTALAVSIEEAARAASSKNMPYNHKQNLR